MKKREALLFSEEVLSTAVFVTDSASVNDSGVYSCTAQSGGFGTGLNTTKSIQVVVQGAYMCTHKCVHYHCSRAGILPPVLRILFQYP